MMMTIYTHIAVLLALQAGTSNRELDVSVYRSWQPPNLTVVEGLFRVDGNMLGTGAECRYTVQLVVRDTTGTPLIRNDWQGSCPPPMGGEARGALETFQFAVVPARYSVEVTIRPEGNPQGMLRKAVTVESLSTETLASDLILGGETGWIEAGKEARWSLRKGQIGIAAASAVVADEADPRIGYYLEVYATRDAPMAGKLTGVIRHPDGREIHRLTLQQLSAVAESRPLVGNFSVAGLAPGQYELETRLELTDTTVVRSHRFHMASPAAPVAAGATGGGYFFTLSEADLAKLFDPIQLFLDQRNRALYERMNADGKRRFLNQYFEGAAPTPGGSGKNALDVYLERSAQLSALFTERTGEIQQEAWQTDRGRIYLLKGPPTNRVTRPVPRAGSPFEVWHYATGSGYAYVFIDETRLGNYRLVFTTDPNEISLPDWERRVSADAVEELIRLGVRIPRTSGTS